MKKLKVKILSIFASGVFALALQYVGLVSRMDMYQGKEPDELEKYRMQR